MAAVVVGRFRFNRFNVNIDSIESESNRANISFRVGFIKKSPIFLGYPSAQDYSITKIDPITLAFRGKSSFFMHSDVNTKISRTKSRPDQDRGIKE